jgi:hypothetical protein
MKFTLGHARTHCASHIANGVAPSSTKALDAINKASMILVDEAHWKHTLVRLRVATYNNCLALPYFLESVLKVNFCTSRGLVQGQWYEFLDAGPGTMGGWSDAGPDLVDLGDGWPTMFPITHGDNARNIIAISTESADVGKQLRIRGLDSYKNEIAPTVPGELLNIFRWKDGVEGSINAHEIVHTSNEFLEISSVVKEQTSGYVTLYAYDPSDHGMWLLAKYAPYETNPSYRRYRITATNEDSQECITALCKMRYVPLVHDADPLPIQNLMAYEWMCKAIHKFEHDELDAGLRFKALALRELEKQLDNNGTIKHMMDVDKQFTMGGIPHYQ